jgi:hypothetical protein
MGSTDRAWVNVVVMKGHVTKEVLAGQGVLVVWTIVRALLARGRKQCDLYLKLCDGFFHGHLTLSRSPKRGDIK